MKFFFSSNQECMKNTIQAVFLNVTHVFVSILKLFGNWALKDVSLFYSIDIWLYKSIFDEIFDNSRVFLCAEHESAIIFCPRLREYGQKIAYNKVPHTRLKPL